MAAPVLGPAERDNVLRAVESGWISSQGEFVTAFETGFARYCGAAHGVAVSNGTTALHLGLAVLGVGPGDEVILPPITHIACINAVTYLGATPVLADCDARTWCLDPERVAAAITERTRVIMPVHLYGQPCDMAAIRALAKRHGIRVLEDAAEAHGAEEHGKRTGSLADLAAFSFYANKIITTGEGGMLVTDDAALAARAKKLRDQAYEPDRRFVHQELGYNYRLTNLQAAIGAAQLAQLDGFVAHRRAVARRYDEKLAGLAGITLPARIPGRDSVHWMYALLVDKKPRAEIVTALRERGIDSRTFFHPLHQQPLYAERFRGLSLPVAERLGAVGLNLPTGNELTLEEVDAVAAALREVL
jgi:perosamine synthetase